MNRETSPKLNPGKLLQLGMAFFASKCLLSAVELDLFTKLGDDRVTAEELRARLDLHPRAVPDFPDALTSLGLLARDGDGPDALYRNTPEGAHFLDRTKPSYIGGIMELANSRLYAAWGNLTEALRTGLQQHGVTEMGKPIFDVLYNTPQRLEEFMKAMAGISRENFRALAEKFDFSGHRTLLDVGGASGELSITVAERHPHLRCITADLDLVEPIAKRRIAEAGLEDRISTTVLDFFADPFPEADIVTMSQVLHDWGRARKLELLRKAYDALPPGGVFIAIEHLIDDARRYNTFGLLMSLNMLIECGEGFDYTGADFKEWAAEVGFDRVEILPLAGPSSAAIAYKRSAVN